MTLKCVFNLDHLNATYHTGEVIRGQVTLTNETVKNFNGKFIAISNSFQILY